MKFPMVWLIGVALLVLCQCGSYTNANAPPQTQRTELDLRAPFDRIMHKLQRFTTKLNIEKILQAGLWFIRNCLGTGSGAPFVLPQKLEQKIVSTVMKHRTEIETAINDNMILADTAPICQLPIVERIHHYVWVEDEEESLNDLVYFFQRFGFPNIYPVLKGVYQAMGCRQEIIDTLPTGPPRRGSSTSSKRSSNIREQLLANHTTASELFPSQIVIQDTCGLLDIIGQLQGTGLLELVMLIDTIIHEVIQQPSIHFLVGKVQEPAKGASFRGLRLIPEVREMIHNLDQVVKMILDMVGLIAYIKDEIGLDLCTFNIVDFLLGFVELILWENHDPMPPYTPVTPPRVCL